VGAPRDPHPGRVAQHAAVPELPELGQQHLRIHHHPGPDQVDGTGAQDPRRHHVQHGLLAIHQQRVTGVVAALEAHHQVGLHGQPVDDLALALVPPLGAHGHQRRHA
jgi:hypothetical protein